MLRKACFALSFVENLNTLKLYTAASMHTAPIVACIGFYSPLFFKKKLQKLTTGAPCIWFIRLHQMRNNGAAEEKAFHTTRCLLSFSNAVRGVMLPLNYRHVL